MFATNLLSGPPRRLGDIAYGRSGDKGINANIGLIARRREDFPRLLREVTAERVAAYFGICRRRSGDSIRIAQP